MDIAVNDWLDMSNLEFIGLALLYLVQTYPQPFIGLLAAWIVVLFLYLGLRESGGEEVPGHEILPH